MAQRWSYDALPTTWLTAVCVVLLLAASGLPWVWRHLAQPAMLVHELGHVLAAWIARRRVEGLADPNATVVTITRGALTGSGALVTYLGGYTAPPALGAVLVACAATGRAGAALTCLLALLLLALWLARNAHGLHLVLAPLGGSGLIYASAEQWFVTAFVLFLGLLLIVTGGWSVLDLWRCHRHDRAVISDATLAARATRALPRSAWVAYFGVVTIACGLAAVGVLWAALARS